MAKLGRFKAINIFLTTISTFKGLSILTTSIQDNINIIKCMQKTGLDFDDALNYFLVKKYRLKGIVSFDKDFDKTDIKRFEPPI